MFEQQAMLFATRICCGRSVVAVLQRWLVFGNSMSDRLGERCSTELLGWGQTPVNAFPPNLGLLFNGIWDQEPYLLSFPFQALCMWEYNNLEIPKANSICFCNLLFYCDLFFLMYQLLSVCVQLSEKPKLFNIKMINRHTTSLKFWFISFKFYGSF